MDHELKIDVEDPREPFIFYPHFPEEHTLNEKCKGWSMRYDLLGQVTRYNKHGFEMEMTGENMTMLRLMMTQPYFNSLFLLTRGNCNGTDKGSGNGGNNASKRSSK